MKEHKHHWVAYHNPRNGRIRVNACLHCGVAKDQMAKSIPCGEVTAENHQMQKMGWVHLSEVA